MTANTANKAKPEPSGFYLAKPAETGYYGRTTSSSGLHRTRQLRLFYA